MEFLNKFTPAGLPPCHLYIKKSMVLMCLRSLSPKQVHCNSTRLILNKATSIFLYCKIASGDNAREEILNTRIEIKHQDEQFIEWNWRQFTLRPAFAKTINKSKGQTPKKRESGWRSRHSLMDSSMLRSPGEETHNILTLQ